MTSICRFCLSFCSQITCVLTEDCDILVKIGKIFSVPISINDTLPNLLCQICKEKIEDIHSFLTKVKQNQTILYDNLNQGIDNLNNFYLSLKSNVNLKEDANVKSSENKENDNVNVDIIGTDDNKKQLHFKEGSLKDYDEVNEIIQSSSDEDIIVSAFKVANKTKEKLLKNKKKLSKSKVTENSGDVDHNNRNEIQTNNSHYYTQDVKLICLTCFQRFTTLNELRTHYNTKHYTTENEVSRVSTKYTIVASDDGLTETFRCAKCNRKYNSRTAINRHMLSHEDNRPFFCKVCGRTYKTTSEIIRHGRAHYGQKLECSQQCGYSTVYAGALREHERRHSSSAFKYKCEKCEKGFQVKTWFLEHQNIHNDLKPFICNICGLGFHMNRYLTAHRSKVHPQSSCMKRYSCVHCSLPCDSKNALTEHLKEQHAIKTSFLCDVCGKTLSNSEQLKLHKRMHLGIKPFTCGICNKSFAKKFNMDLHTRTHSGVRAWPCACCGKCYTQRSSLVRHQARSHVRSPQKCSKCQRSFTNTRGFETHKKLCLD